MAEYRIKQVTGPNTEPAVQTGYKTFGVICEIPGTSTQKHVHVEFAPMAYPPTPNQFLCAVVNALDPDTLDDDPGNCA